MSLPAGVLDEDLSPPPPEPRATTATTPATSARPAATGHSRPMPFLPSEDCWGGTGGPPCGEAAGGGCAGGAGGCAEGAGGCADGAGGCAEGAGGSCGDTNSSPVWLGGCGGGLPEPCAGAAAGGT